LRTVWRELRVAAAVQGMGQEAHKMVRAVGEKALEII
jgi:hypothetical protein